jgi:hypothetical protein
MPLNPHRCCPSPKRTDRPRTISNVRTKSPSSKKGSQRNLTFRISLFRTLQICWMSAADCETLSSELPYSCSSSFWFFEGSTSTPGCITTFRTIFSPMKFLCIPSALRPPSHLKTPAFSNPSRAIGRTGSPPQTDPSRCSYRRSR